MKKMRLDLETLTVESLALGGQPVGELASVTRFCTAYNTCDGCTWETCAC
ncbi:MAG TPA: hypothetical protein VF092_04490 [Longimicrobium sp.]